MNSDLTGPPPMTDIQHSDEGLAHSPEGAPIPAVQSGAVAWRIDVPNGNYGFATSEAGAVNASRHSGGTITPLYAAPQSEPLPGGVGERDRLVAVRDALLVAGGADPSNGVCRFSYWNLDKLNKAFDAALASLTIKGDAR